MVHIVRMLRSFNEEKWISCVAGVGGSAKATRMIMDELECSFSKADKLARCKYPSLPTPSEQKALAKLFKCKRDVLFPIIGVIEELKAS